MWEATHTCKGSTLRCWVMLRTRGGGLLQDETDEMELRRQRPTSMSSVRRFSGALSDLARGSSRGQGPDRSACW